MLRTGSSRWLRSGAAVCGGLAISSLGFLLETANPRSEVQDNLAWAVLGLGTSLVGVGASMPFTRTARALQIGLATPFVGFTVLAWAYWIYLIIAATLFR